MGVQYFLSGSVCKPALPDTLTLDIKFYRVYIRRLRKPVKKTPERLQHGIAGAFVFITVHGKRC